MTDYSDRLWEDETPVKEKPKTKSKSLSDYGVPLTTSVGRSGILMPLVKNHFRVKFYDFYNECNLDLSSNLICCDLPKLKSNINHDEKYNSYTAESPAWEPISFKFRNDVANVVMTRLMDMVQKQLKDHTAEFKIIIESLDPTNGDKIICTYMIENCQIFKFDVGEMSYASCELILTIKHKNASFS